VNDPVGAVQDRSFARASAATEFQARPGDWARVWLLLRAEKILSYAEPSVPLG
jgi:hypothetical protein